MQVSLAPSPTSVSLSVRKSITLSDFHSVSVPETSQSLEMTLWWPTWWLTWRPTWRCTRWPTWRWTRWPTRRQTWWPTCLLSGPNGHWASTTQVICDISHMYALHSFWIWPLDCAIWLPIGRLGGATCIYYILILASSRDDICRDRFLAKMSNEWSIFFILHKSLCSFYAKHWLNLHILRKHLCHFCMYKYCVSLCTSFMQKVQWVNKFTHIA